MSNILSLAFLGGSVGTGEWVVLFMVILIVVGPKRLPEVARKLGRTMEMFRRAADEFKDQLLNMDREPPAPYTPPSPTDTSPAADGETQPDMDESYGTPYSDAADYPGNEDQMMDGAAQEAPEAAAAAENGEADAAVEKTGGADTSAESAP